MRLSFLFLPLCFFSQLTFAMDCLPAKIMQQQIYNHLEVGYKTWDSGVAGYQRVHGLSSKNGYYLLGFQYNQWEIVPQKKPIADVLSLDDARRVVRDGLETLSEGVFQGYESSSYGSSRVMLCSYTVTFNDDIYTIIAKGRSKS